MAVVPRARPPDAWIDELGLASARHDIPWERLRNRALTRRERILLREFYDARYAQRSDYTARHPWHAVSAKFRIALARLVFGGLGKTLDAGCSAGEVVRAARAQGVEAWGFDLCPDLGDIAYDEVREHLRVGRFDHIPYAPSDGFETLVSYDVFEHVPLDELERFPAELARLGIRQIACVISADTISEAHITIQDTAFWVALLARAGFRLLEERTRSLDATLVPVAWDPRAAKVVWARYAQTGAPRNAWNRVPGHLFFRREG